MPRPLVFLTLVLMVGTCLASSSAAEDGARIQKHHLVFPYEWVGTWSAHHEGSGGGLVQVLDTEGEICAGQEVVPWVLEPLFPFFGLLSLNPGLCGGAVTAAGFDISCVGDGSDGLCTFYTDFHIVGSLDGDTATITTTTTYHEDCPPPCGALCGDGPARGPELKRAGVVVSQLTRTSLDATSCTSIDTRSSSWGVAKARYRLK